MTRPPLAHKVQRPTRPPLAHKVQRPTRYVPADAHHTVDHLRRVMRAERKRIGPPVVIRIEVVR